MIFTEPPRFSIIIPVYHAGFFLKNILASALELDAPPRSFEILVAGRRDDADPAAITAAVVSEAPFALRYVGAAGSRKPAFLNAACREARGDILAFTDDDCVLRPDWLARLREALEDSSVPSLVGGRDELEPGASAFALALDEVLHSPFVTGTLSMDESTPSTMGHPRLYNMALPRRLALKTAVEGPNGALWVFDESLPGHEDLDLARRVERAGGQVRLVSAVRVGHFRATTWGGTIAWNFRLAQAARMLRVQRIRHLLLAGYFAAVSGLSAAAPFRPAAAVALAVLAAACLLPVLIWAVFTGVRKRRLSTAALFPGLLISLYAARVAGYLTGRPRISGKRRDLTTRISTNG